MDAGQSWLTSSVSFTFLCKEGEYLDGITCHQCPDGGVCSGAVDFYPKQGYWRQQEASVSSPLYKCPMLEKACSGGTASWECKEGYRLITCAECDSGFHMSGDACLPCDSVSTVQAALSVLTAAVLLAVAFYALYKYRLIVACWSGSALVHPKRAPTETTTDVVARRDPAVAESVQRAEADVEELGEGVLSIRQMSKAAFYLQTASKFMGVARIIISYVQVVPASVALFTSVRWPEPFIRMTNALSVFNLDFLNFVSMDCVVEPSQWNRLVVILVGQIVTISALLLGASLRVSISRDRHDSVTIWNQHIRWIFLFLFLIFPGGSTVALQSLHCIEIGDASYMVADMSVECFASDWMAHMPLILAAIFAYPIGLPALFFGVLYFNRHQLHSSQQCIERYGEMYSSYREEFWYYDIVEMGRKLAQTSAVMFIASGVLPDFLLADVLLCVSSQVLRFRSSFHWGLLWSF